jgi:hypothetical protein
MVVVVVLVPEVPVATELISADKVELAALAEAEFKVRFPLIQINFMDRVEEAVELLQVMWRQPAKPMALVVPAAIAVWAAMEELFPAQKHRQHLEQMTRALAVEVRDGFSTAQLLTVKVEMAQTE